MATKINNEQRGAFARIVDKTQFVDKELEAKLAEELGVLLKKYSPNVTKHTNLSKMIEKLSEQMDRLKEDRDVVETALDKVGIDHDTSGYGEDKTESWELTWKKREEFTEKLNGKFKNFKEQITKKIWASQEVEVAEKLVDEFLARNKVK